MDKLLNVTSSPHVRVKPDTQKIMLCVIIALMPATLFGIWNFGINAFILVVASVVSAVLAEYIYNMIVKKKQTVMDGSAALTGLLLALNLPSTLPWWMAVIGSAFAIIVVKSLFGGLGQNFMNPALGARCFLLISFAGPMTDFSGYKDYADVFSSATPLASLKAGQAVDTMRMFIGTIPGTIGETSVICIVIGAIFLLLCGIIDLRIPGAYILTFLVFIILFGGRGLDSDYIAAQLCGGGLMLGAFFMATDYVTSPITPLGKIIFGIICGILTGVFRLFAPGAEGVSYSIIIANLLVPLIEKWTVPTAFGIVKEKKVKEGGAQ